MPDDKRQAAGLGHRVQKADQHSATGDDRHNTDHRKLPAGERRNRPTCAELNERAASGLHTVLHRRERRRAVHVAVLPAGKILQGKTIDIVAEFKFVLSGVYPRRRVNSAAHRRSPGPTAAL